MVMQQGLHTRLLMLDAQDMAVKEQVRVRGCGCVWWVRGGCVQCRVLLHAWPLHRPGRQAGRGAGHPCGHHPRHQASARLAHNTPPRRWSGLTPPPRRPTSCPWLAARPCARAAAWQATRAAWCCWGRAAACTAAGSWRGRSGCARCRCARAEAGCVQGAGRSTSWAHAACVAVLFDPHALPLPSTTRAPPACTPPPAGRGQAAPGPAPRLGPVHAPPGAHAGAGGCGPAPHALGRLAGGAGACAGGCMCGQSQPHAV